jgi:hypothetical protein
MIIRLLERLQPRRRHLTILVGLLVLTFVLTFVLAHQARSAEIERQRVVQTRLHEVAEGIVVEWSRKFQMFVHNEVSPVVRPLSAAARDPQLALEVYAAFARQFGFCDGCSGASAGSRFFALEHGTVVHAIGELPDTAVLTAVWREAADGRFAPLSDWFGIALYMTAAGGDVTPVAAVVQLDTAFNPVRLYGALLTERRATEMLQYAFGTGGFVATLGSSLPQDSLFSLAAVVGGVSLLGPVPETNAAAQTAMPDDGPVPGVTLHVGLLPSVEQLLVLSPPSSARVPLFGALLAIIGGLIVLALLLVRRESELVRLRADFMSGVSHEFRTPLAQIRMFAEMLLLGRARSDFERRRSLEIIDQEAQRLTHLIENVLAYSKAEAGRQRIKPEPLSLPTRCAAPSRSSACSAARVRSSSAARSRSRSAPPSTPARCGRCW